MEDLEILATFNAKLCRLNIDILPLMRKGFQRNILIFGFLAVLGTASDASTAASAQISAVTSATEGLASIVHPGARTGLPACATSTVWSINLTSPGGQSTFSAALSAYIAQRPISIAGTGTCNAYGQEYVGYIAM